MFKGNYLLLLVVVALLFDPEVALSFSSSSLLLLLLLCFSAFLLASFSFSRVAWRSFFCSAASFLHCSSVVEKRLGRGKG